MNNEDTVEEASRRVLMEMVNSSPRTRQELEASYGPDNVWDTMELTRDFAVIAFAAPFCLVERRSNAEKGTVMFQHNPRFYFGFTAAV